MGAGSTIENYYCNLAREDYYTAGGEPPGYWLGHGAKMLGLDGMVAVEQLRQTLHGQHPNGNPLVQGAGEHHRPGWDCTFSAPKSVSVAWAIASIQTRNDIATAQANAVKVALKFIEQEACKARRGKAGLQQEKVSGLVAACFEHGTSREGDPQLHTHCLLHNLAQRSDGSWGGIESLRLFQWKMAAGAVYRAELASQLKSLGFSVERDNDSFRLTAISKPLDKLFSKRRIQIEQKLADTGYSSAAASQVAALATRQHKTEVDRSLLFTQWAEQAKTLGLEAGMDVAGIESQNKNLAGKESSHIKTNDTINSTVNPSMPTHSELFLTLTQQASTFKLEDIYRHAAVAAQGILDVKGLNGYVRAIKHHDQLVKLGMDDHGAPRYTTKEMLQIEQRIASDAISRSTETNHHVAQHLFDQAITARPTISDEQKKALYTLTQNSGGIACVQGIAGSGKSYLMDACREVYEQSKFNVRGCALSGKAAQGLQEGSHIPSQTLHSLLDQLDKGKIVLSSKDIIVLDEAGMVGSRQFASLMHHVAKHGAKLIAIGDSRQLQPIDAGGAFRIITNHIAYAELNDIRRQQADADKQVVRDLASGNASEAIASLDARGLLTDAIDIPTAMQTLVNDWQQDVAALDQKLILAGTKAEARILNGLIRAALQKDQKLAKVSTEIEVSGGALRQFSEGDRMLFTRNSIQLGVKNGTLGKLTRISTNQQGECEMTVMTDEGNTVKFSPTAVDGYNHLDHGYAMSVHKAQGATVSSAYLLLSETMGDREWAYVGASRARGTTRLYCTTDMKQTLAKTLSKSRQKTSALDYLQTQVQIQAQTKNRAKSSDQPVVLPTAPTTPVKAKPKFLELERSL